MIVLEQRPVISYGATRVVTVDLTPQLEGSRTLTGTPTVTEVGTVTKDSNGDITYDSDGDPAYTSSTDLTLTNKSINSAALSGVLGKTVAANKGVQFLVSGQGDDKIYVIQVSVGTTGSPAETLTYWLLLTVD